MYSVFCIFGLLNFFALYLAARQVALERLLHQLERHRNGPAVAVVQRVQEVNPFDRAPLAMVVMPTDQVAFIRPGLLLDGVVAPKLLSK
ncbi:MAG: hypothetical protein I8H91_07600 [Burkholderiales bacterium]|jgi:hypothetical protein|nr:hypothetical protein [Burkholderiales bacterium]